MKAIVTVTGKDAVGIIAGVCQELASLGVNILDINQTVMDGFFAMNMLVDLSTSEKSYELVRDVFSMMLNATSWGPTPGRGAPVR